MWSWSVLSVKCEYMRIGGLGDCLLVGFFFVFLCYYLICFVFFSFSSRRRHTRFDCDWSSDVCSSDLRHRGVPRLGARRAAFRHCPESWTLRLETASSAPSAIRRSSGCAARRSSPAAA